MLGYHAISSSPISSMQNYRSILYRFVGVVKDTLYSVMSNIRSFNFISYSKDRSFEDNTKNITYNDISKDRSFEDDTMKKSVKDFNTSSSFDTPNRLTSFDHINRNFESTDNEKVKTFSSKRTFTFEDKDR